MVSPSYAQSLRSQILDDATLPVQRYDAGGEVADDHGTSHVSVLAPNGDAVSVTSTLNY